ncbi:MAG TPA: alpha/beta hydrolase [Sporichthyaceae bacterium]|jgi:pimeloyl-ACP methyl ester carboxylesterase
MSLLAAACATATLFAVTPAVAAPGVAAQQSGIVELPISFDVANTNTSKLSCHSDGSNYTVKGTLVAPQAALKSGKAAMLYLHAVTWGAYYWQFKGVTGYDYARQMAELGHVSVAVDRLGYGASGKPAGLDTCFGSEADVAHQMVEALRAGSYRLDGAKPTAFKKVFVGGASVGGLTTHILAYSFHDIDGVFNESWGDGVGTPFTASEVSDVYHRCAQGGDAGAPADYAAFFKNSRDKFYFNSAEQAVRTAVPPLNPDPCGQLESIPAGIAADYQHLGEIDVPVLVMFGDADAVFGPHPLAIDQMADRYTGSPEVTKSVIPAASHYPLVEAAHLQVVHDVDAWLTRNGG